MKLNILMIDDDPTSIDLFKAIILKSKDIAQFISGKLFGKKKSRGGVEWWSYGEIRI